MTRTLCAAPPRSEPIRLLAGPRGEPEGGSLSATFHVEAPELQEAAWKAFWVYLHAVWDADVVLMADSKLEVQEET